MATRKRKTVYPPARTDTKPAPRAGAGPEPYVRPTVATIDLTAGSGRAGLAVGDRVRIAGGGLYSGEFYRELARVLRHRGRLFHYTGAPNRLTSGRDVTREVARRLKASGFETRLEGDGVLAVKTG